MQYQLCYFFVILSFYFIHSLQLKPTSLSSLLANSPKYAIRRQTNVQMAFPGLSEISHEISNKISISQLLPICLTPTSDTTVVNDPTAGMTPEEITNYMSNVGGGLCGYPDYVREFAGIALNANLVFFGVLTIGYVVLGELLVPF